MWCFFVHKKLLLCLICYSVAKGIIVSDLLEKREGRKSAPLFTEVL